MCGLNGTFAYHSAAATVDRAEVVRVRDAMTARGPDGCGAWFSDDGRLGLGHRRLSILDLSDRAAQPMISADGNFVVVFNGEIYNAPELRRGLEAEGVSFRTTSDTEVLLHLFARDGADMVHKLRGMFALAIWDRQQRRLFLARDLYGIKPLYTANDGRTFRFASQVKALLAGGRVSRDPEAAGIVGFHLFGSVPEPFTLYREIRSLPAGHTQWVFDDGPREPKPYANIATILSQGAKAPITPAELPERLRSGVADSVRAHLLADVEVGIFLSAGIDSGALLGVMRDTGSTGIRAITLAFEEFRGTDEDEAPLASGVAALYGAKHVVRRVGEREFRDDLPAILNAMDQPSIDGVNTWFVAKAAKEAGLKVAISGLGGDELLAGYPSFVDVPRWRRRYGALAKIPGIGRMARQIIAATLPGLAAEWPKALGMLEHAGTWGGAYMLRRGLHLPHELGALVDQDVVRDGLRRLALDRHLSAAITPDPGSITGHVMALESSHYLRNQLLRDADWAGMAHSLEIRVPLVDSALLRTVAPAIPRIAPGRGKALLAAVPQTPLPAVVAARAKTGFGVPTGAWMEAVVGQARAPMSKGLVSRRWSSFVLSGVSGADNWLEAA